MAFKNFQGAKIIRNGEKLNTIKATGIRHQASGRSDLFM
jgi:hypothetical protein